MKGYVKWFAGFLLLMPLGIQAQEKPLKWDLRACINYARAENIQVKQSKVTLEESRENTLQAKSALFPSLSFSTGHNLVNHPKATDTDQNNYSGSYGLNSSVSLYNGGKLKNTVRKQEIQDQAQELVVKETENNIELAITEAFVQVLYADESVRINQNTVDVSEAQCMRARELQKAGAISRTDLAQLESQYSTDKYQLVVARTSLDNMKLQLKQLLELEVTDDMELLVPELNDGQVLTVLPGKVSVYETSLNIIPQIQYGLLNIDVAGLEKERAKAGYLPALNLTAGIGTGHSSGTDYSFSTQLKRTFNESVGLSLNIPIFSNRSNKTAVKLAQLSIDNMELSLQGLKKELLKSVETVYLDAVSAQDRYKAARENLNAVRLSYRLVEEQFNLGMKNTVELLTEKNNYLTAQQELLQAKYMALLNQQFLNFYQGKEIKL